MARWQGSTTARGYGASHQSERARRLGQYQPGDPCAIGGEPMTWLMPLARRYLDLPHDHVNGGYLPGLSCRKHNRGEGASRGNRMRTSKPRPFATSRAWLVNLSSSRP